MSTDHDLKAEAKDVYGRANAAMLKGVPALMAIPAIRSACDDVERQYLEVMQAEKTHSEYTEDKDPIIEKMRAALAGKGGLDPSSPVKRKIVGEVSKYDRTVHNLVGQIANLKEGLEYLRLKLQDELVAQKAKKEEEEKAKKVAAIDAELMGLLAELEVEHALDEESHIHTINSDDTAQTNNKDDPGKKLLIDFVSKVGPSTPSDGSNVAVDDCSPFSSPPEGSPPRAEETVAAAQSETPREEEDAGAAKKLTLEMTGKFSLGNTGANGNVEGALETPSSAKKPAVKKAIAKKPGDDLGAPSSAKKPAIKNLGDDLGASAKKPAVKKAIAKKPGDDLGAPSSAKKPAIKKLGDDLGAPSSAKKPAIKKPGDDLGAPAKKPAINKAIAKKLGDDLGAPSSAKKPAINKAIAKKLGDDLGAPSSAKKPSGTSTSGALANLINLDDLMTVNPNKNAGIPLRATTTTKDATGTGRLLSGPPADIVVDPNGKDEDAVSQLSMGTGRKSVTRSVSAENQLRSLFNGTVLDSDVLGSIDFHGMTSNEWKEYDVIGQVEKALESGYKLPTIKNYFKTLLDAVHENDSFATSSFAANIRTTCIEPGRVAYVTNEGRVYVLSNMFLSKHFEKGSKDTLAGKFGGPNASVPDKKKFPTTVGRFLIYLGALSPGYCKNGPIDVTDAKYAGLF